MAPNTPPWEGERGRVSENWFQFLVGEGAQKRSLIEGRKSRAQTSAKGQKNSLPQSRTPRYDNGPESLLLTCFRGRGGRPGTKKQYYSFAEGQTNLMYSAQSKGTPGGQNMSMRAKGWFPGHTPRRKSNPCPNDKKRAARDSARFGRRSCVKKKIKRPLSSSMKKRGMPSHPAGATDSSRAERL